MRANFVRAGFCGSAQRGGKEIAEILFDSSVHKTGWKLIPSQDFGELLNVVVEANPCVTDFKCQFQME